MLIGGVIGALIGWGKSMLCGRGNIPPCAENPANTGRIGRLGRAVRMVGCGDMVNWLRICCGIALWGWGFCILPP
ncbi:hypothetical protein, partial [Bartonella florencae]|uniref:hypothetical protein n=1 Tax=Bartonella florencae TaxID=928210 RepID=UPI0018DD98FE